MDVLPENIKSQFDGCSLNIVTHSMSPNVTPEISLMSECSRTSLEIAFERLLARVDANVTN